ncbi:hypothetical protein CTM76_12475 [Photobacterium phosphoreum]|nr:hypothetical protein UB41_08165 [Photobacterium phosphoreum]MCD9463496.1 hypothetical protein [Photobacterium phosphoreum]MCD9471451.1 hypothetical protein [Photobacterium phosphoreum]OBU26821.1 hypothetical protein AYY24_10040 [Photobacterium phosphoreum]OBU30291.1 hypothetical protein AYY25_09145 [Photobacterium phosphoreum]
MIENFFDSFHNQLSLLLLLYYGISLLNKAISLQYNSELKVGLLRYKNEIMAVKIVAITTVGSRHKKCTEVHFFIDNAEGL